MARATQVQLEAKLGLAEFSLSNTKDETNRLRLVRLINEIKIALGHY